MGQEGNHFVREAATSGERFDVVITDLGMPYVDGRQVASSVKSASSRNSRDHADGLGQRLGLMAIPRM